MTLHSYLLFLRANWKRISILTLVGIIAAMVYCLSITPKFVATSQIFLSTPRFSNVTSFNASPYAADQYTQQRARSYVQLVSREELAQRVIKKLKIDMQPAALAAATSASVVPDTVLIDISVKAASPVEAKDLTDAMTAELISDIRLLESRSGLGVSVVEPVVTAPAVVPKAPSEPNITIYLLLGAAGGFLIGITAASRLLRRSVDSSQVEQVTGSPVLGIPNSGVVDSGGTADDALSTAEVLSRQWENIQKRVKFELGESDGAVLVVTTEDGSGRSSASASELGRAFAIAGSRALLVGTQTVANVDHLSGQPGAPGLAEVIAGESQLQDAIRPADDENLFLIAGPPAGVAAPLLQSEKFRENVGRMREAFDFVLFDSSAFLKQTEPNLLTELADAVILVMAETDVNRRELTAALRSIRERGMRLLGSILTSDSPADTGSGTRRTFVTSNGRA